MIKNIYLILPTILLLSFLNVSCSHRKYKKHKTDSFVIVKPINGSKIKGWVQFHKINRKQVRIRAEIQGLTPLKKYGFHIHEYGDCREEGAKAGSHFNPHKALHAGPHSPHRHEGDLGNLEAGKDGVARTEKVIKLKCRHLKIGGRSVIIHAQEDDLKSQPTGNAGTRIGCGVIGTVKTHKK